jgi:hypothetical protein
MGQDWRPDEAVSPRLVKALMRMLDDKIAQGNNSRDVSHWVTARTLFTILYVFSLRGNEGLLADTIKGICDEYTAGRSNDPSYSALALLGQVKGEQHRRQHLMYSVDETSSGIQVRKAFADLILVREHKCRFSGPAICDTEGIQWTTAVANEFCMSSFLSCLIGIQHCSRLTLVPMGPSWRNTMCTVHSVEHSTRGPYPKKWPWQTSGSSIAGKR